MPPELDSSIKSAAAAEGTSYRRMAGGSARFGQIPIGARFNH